MKLRLCKPKQVCCIIDDMGDKRNRPPVPTYIKFYSVDKYDRHKFRLLLNKWLKTEEGKNRTIATLKQKQIEILRECYEFDEQGKIFKNSDEKHIYRIGTLHKIYERIYEYVIMYSMFNTKKIDEITIDNEGREAELSNTWSLSLCARIKIHIRLLRLLKGGYIIKDALQALKNGEYEQYRELQRAKIQKGLL